MTRHVPLPVGAIALVLLWFVSIGPRARNSASSSGRTAHVAPVPDFRGTWLEEEPLDSAHPMRLCIVQDKSSITVYIRKCPPSEMR